MAIETPGWSGFAGGAGAACATSAPSISGAQDLDCEGAASVTLTVSGGVAPYNWTTTKGQLDTSTGTTVILTPTANPYSGIAGTQAYSITTKIIQVFCSCKTSVWDCYGTKWQTCLGTNACTTGYPNGCSCSNCTTASDAVCDARCTPCQCGKSACSGSGCPEDNAHNFCISGTGDCQPCAISMDGCAVVTVTDALSQTAFVTICPTPRSTL